MLVYYKKDPWPIPHPSDSCLPLLHALRHLRAESAAAEEEEDEATPITMGRGGVSGRGIDDDDGGLLGRRRRVTQKQNIGGIRSPPPKCFLGLTSPSLFLIKFGLLSSEVN